MSNKDETTPTPTPPSETELGKDAISADSQAQQAENDLKDDDSTPNYYEHPDDLRGGDDE